MKTIFTTLIASTLLVACTSVKNIYQKNDINDRQWEKLVKNYLKTPGDTANSNKLVYGYQLLLDGELNNIERLKNIQSLTAKEQLISAYASLQGLYNEVAAVPALRQLLHPGNVMAEKQAAIQNAALAWYQHGENLLDENNWQAGREAVGVFGKVANWLPNFKNTNTLLQEAREMGTIDAVLQPLRSEEFYQQANYTNSRQGFVYQLVSDLGSAWANTDMYRVYDARETQEMQLQPDWVIEPVLTRMEVSPIQYRRSSRTITKKIEVGKDSVKNPIYKTITAELFVTEASVVARGEMDARISDVLNQQKVNRRSFGESFAIVETTATYKGDKNALSNADWALVNNKNTIRADERWMQEKVLEKIYPQVLGYLRNELR